LNYIIEIATTDFTLLNPLLKVVLTALNYVLHLAMGAQQLLTEQ
jgi:hypothetical protein